MLFDIIKDIIDVIFPPEEVPVPKLEPVMNLQRVKANVKITWTPNASTKVTGQRIVVTRDGEIFIHKMLEPETAAFSFAAKDDSKVTITISPFDGVNLGDGSTIEFVV